MPTLTDRGAAQAPNDNLTAQQTADLLGLSLRTVYTLLRNGRIPAFRPGSHWYISRKRLLAWIEDEMAGQSGRSASRDDDRWR